MVTHSDIVKRTGAASLFKLLTARGLKLSAITVQKWADRDSIPGEYWDHIAALGIATLEELAKAVAACPIVEKAG